MIDILLLILGLVVAITIGVLGTKDIAERCNEPFGKITDTDTSDELKGKSKN